MALLSHSFVLGSNGAGQEHCVGTQLYLRAGGYEIAVGTRLGAASARGRVRMFRAMIACEAIELGTARAFELGISVEDRSERLPIEP